MKKNRICTTISQKHLEILKKQAEKFGTQQKALELALDYLENNSKPGTELSREEKFTIRAIRTKAACVVQKDGLKIIMESADNEKFEEYVNRHKPLEYTIEFYHQKPLKECSLREVIDGIVFNARVANWFDSIDCADDNGCYMLKITHSMGLSVSEQTKISIESVLKTYGLKAESTISPKTIFIKIFKN